MRATWLPKEVLHRIQGDWALIIDDDAREPHRHGRAAARRVTVIPVASLGVHTRDKLPMLCLLGMRTAQTILVRIDEADVPHGALTKLIEATAAAAADADSAGDGASGEGGGARRSGPALRRGGPLTGVTHGSSCGWAMVCAWAFNLGILVSGLAFFLFALLVLFEDATPQ